MIWSTTRGDLVAALAVAQGKFADPEKGALAGKEGVKQWRYANLADFLPDVRAVLSAEGIAILQSTDEDGKHLITELVKGEQWVRVLNPLGEAGTTQAFGSEITYARRYALMAILGLAAVDDDDDGKAANDAPPPTRKRAEPAPKREATPKREPTPTPTPKETLDEGEVEVFREWLAGSRKKAFTPLVDKTVEEADQIRHWLTTSEGRHVIVQWRNATSQPGGTP